MAHCHRLLKEAPTEMTTATDPPPPLRKRNKLMMSVSSQEHGGTAAHGGADGGSPTLISPPRSKPVTDQPPPDSDALRWKRKAKERKQELLRLREDLKLAEEASRSNAFSQVASCKCYFFDDLGKLSRGSDDHGFGDVLRRRFLRQVRYLENWRGSDDAYRRHHHLFGVDSIDGLEQLSAAVDFLAKLCDTVSSVEDVHFANWSHQAVDFILASLKNLLSLGENLETIEGIVDRLILGLVRRMSPAEDSRESITQDLQFSIQHLIRKLGSEPYFGQRALLAVCQKIYVVAESLLFADPFDDKFPVMHQSMYILIQLLELLVCDYLLPWSNDGNFDHLLFEEWLTSIVHARKAVGLLESRNSLYMLYMDRLIGELARLFGQVPSFSNLNPDTLNKLFN